MQTAVATKVIPDGWYTVSIEGAGHRTFRLETQAPDASFAPGKRILAFLGKDCEYVSFAFVNGPYINPWKRFQSGYGLIIAAARFLISGDYEKAGLMYAQESGNCYRCNRTLTTPESIAAGIGPVCANK